MEWNPVNLVPTANISPEENGRDIWPWGRGWESSNTKITIEFCLITDN